MSEEQEKFDRQDDTQLARLLQSGLAAPELRPEFVESLKQSLTEQVRQAVPGHNGRPATNGLAPNLKLVAEENGAAAAKRKRSVLYSVAAAATLLALVVFWDNGSAYGWADVLRALEKCQWIQASSAKGNVNAWTSATGVVAVQSPQRLLFVDGQQRLRRDYTSSDRIIVQRPLKANSGRSRQQAILAILAAEDVQQQVDLDLTRDLQLVEESWRETRAPGSNEVQIELRVVLQPVGSGGALVRLLFVLDPATRLPISCAVLGHAEEHTAEYQFDYPRQGPNSIYALGVPAETEVVATVKSSQVLAESPAGEGESRRVASVSVAKSAPQATVAVEAAVEVPAEQVVAETVVALDDSVEDAGDELSPVAPRQVATSPEPLPSGGWNSELPTELPPRDDLVDQLNSQLAKHWKSQGISPAEPATDSEFLRRVYLDLTGRIPMVSEVYQFTEDSRPDRRELLIDDLLARRDHATHLAAVWRTMLLPDGVDATGYGGTAKFDEWLADRFGRNVPYDQLVSDLLLAEGRVIDSGPILFYAALKLNPEELAGKTARTFLGTRMECAQCHDHPFDDSISQHDFWGFAAYFAQISRPLGKMETTSLVLRVRDNLRGEVMLPDSEEVVPPRLPSRIESAVQEEEARSRRRQLVDWLTSQNNRLFARATVNRVWEHLFGLGLVNPVDDMREDNEPISPEVLDLLSRDFAASGFDLRRLLQVLVLSDAYQLSSRSATDEPSQGLNFARMNIKSFTADQLYDCIAVATQNDKMLAGTASQGQLAREGNSARQAFIEQFRAPPGQRTDYHAGIPQALAMMHGGLIHGSTGLASSGLLQSLEAPFFTDQKRVETLFLATFSRLPRDEELPAMLDHVSSATDEAGRQQSLGDVLWALLNSAEFTFIH